MKYLAIDASLGGTGIRDLYSGGYIDSMDLLLSPVLSNYIQEWLQRYHEAHYDGFSDQQIVQELDLAGREIAYAVKAELIDVKMEYFSDAKMEKENID